MMASAGLVPPVKAQLMREEVGERPFVARPACGGGDQLDAAVVAEDALAVGDWR